MTDRRFLNDRLGARFSILHGRWKIGYLALILCTVFLCRCSDSDTVVQPSPTPNTGSLVGPGWAEEAAFAFDPDLVVEEKTNVILHLERGTDEAVSSARVMFTAGEVFNICLDPKNNFITKMEMVNTATGGVDAVVTPDEECAAFQPEPVPYEVQVYHRADLVTPERLPAFMNKISSWDYEAIKDLNAGNNKTWREARAMNGEDPLNAGFQGPGRLRDPEGYFVAQMIHPSTNATPVEQVDAGLRKYAYVGFPVGESQGEFTQPFSWTWNLGEEYGYLMLQPIFAMGVDNNHSCWEASVPFSGAYYYGGFFLHYKTIYAGVNSVLPYWGSDSSTAYLRFCVTKKPTECTEDKLFFSDRFIAGGYSQAGSGFSLDHRASVEIIDMGNERTTFVLYPKPESGLGVCPSPYENSLALWNTYGLSSTASLLTGPADAPSCTCTSNSAGDVNPLWQIPSETSTNLNSASLQYCSNFAPSFFYYPDGSILTGDRALTDNEVAFFEKTNYGGRVYVFYLTGNEDNDAWSSTQGAGLLSYWPNGDKATIQSVKVGKNVLAKVYTGSTYEINESPDGYRIYSGGDYSMIDSGNAWVTDGGNGAALEVANRSTYLVSERWCCDCSFAGKDLSGAALEKTIVANSNFTQANLTGASLKGSEITGANFTGANLKQADLSNVNAAVSSEAQYYGKAVFDYAFMQDTNMSGANVNGVTFTSANFYSSTMPGDCNDWSKTAGCASLRNASAVNTSFNNAMMNGIDMTGITANGANFDNAMLVAANLSNAVLSQSTGGAGRSITFNNAYLMGANFQGSTPTHAVFTNSYVSCEEQKTYVFELNQNHIAFQGYWGDLKNNSASCAGYYAASATQGLDLNGENILCPAEGASNPCCSHTPCASCDGSMEPTVPMDQQVVQPALESVNNLFPSWCENGPDTNWGDEWIQ